MSTRPGSSFGKEATIAGWGVSEEKKEVGGGEESTKVKEEELEELMSMVE